MSMLVPGWEGYQGTKQGYKSVVGWMADGVGSSWEEGRYVGSWSGEWM